MFPLQHTVILYSVIERKMVQSAIVGVFYITPSKWFTELHLEKKKHRFCQQNYNFLESILLLRFLYNHCIRSQQYSHDTQLLQSNNTVQQSLSSEGCFEVYSTCFHRTDKKICSNLPTSWRLGIRRSKNTTKLTQDEGKSSSHCQCPGPLGTQGTSCFRFPGDTKKLTYIAS